jgi:hypothetical protein
MTITPVGHHETKYVRKLDVREIQNGQQPALRGNDYFLSKARLDDPILPTLKWEPTHPLPHRICIAAKDPAIFLQLKDNAAFMLVYLNIRC